MARMTLAQAYVFKASKRLTILDVLNREEFYSDVVREAQEPVELALKGILREIGIDPPQAARRGRLGDVDLIPTAEYKPEDAVRAMEEAAYVAAIARQVVPLPDGQETHRI